MIESDRRKEQYRKNLTHECFISDLNDHLTGLEHDLLEKCETNSPTHNVLFIVGAPRSGTTLLSQLLSATGCFAYITNIAARFWGAPAVGLMFQSLMEQYRLQSNELLLESTHGVTHEPFSPHEFGYFWKHWLNLNNPNSDAWYRLADPSRFLKTLASMEQAYDLPLMFKSICVSFVIDELSRILPRAKFVWIRRSTLYNCQSVLKLRQDVWGDVTNWPEDCFYQCDDVELKSPAELVVDQVDLIERTIADSFRRLPSDRFLSLGYEELCLDTRTTITKVLDAVGMHSERVDALPESLPVRNSKVLPCEVFNELEKLIREKDA